MRYSGSPRVDAADVDEHHRVEAELLQDAVTADPRVGAGVVEREQQRPRGKIDRFALHEVDERLQVDRLVPRVSDHRHLLGEVLGIHAVGGVGGVREVALRPDPVVDSTGIADRSGGSFAQTFFSSPVSSTSGAGAGVRDACAFVTEEVVSPGLRRRRRRAQAAGQGNECTADSLIQDTVTVDHVLVRGRAVAAQRMRLVSPHRLCAVAASRRRRSSVAGGVMRTRRSRPDRARRSCAWRRTRSSRGTEAMPEGGWAWRSAIQAPHHQTDRDVGAASIGEGLLAAYAVTRDPRYLRAARCGGRLPARRRRAGGRRAALAGLGRSGRTPFGDALHELRRRRGRDQRLPLELSDVTREPRFRTGALGGMRWVVAQAAGPVLPAAPRAPGAGRTIRPGASRTTASAWARRASCSPSTRSPTARATARFRAYARAGAARLRALTEDGRARCPQGSERPDALETGFLSGSAGAAYMFLERYAHDHARVDLATATPAARMGERPGRSPTPRAGSAGRSPATTRACRVGLRAR